jgi:hypothetical protein
VGPTCHHVIQQSLSTTFFFHTEMLPPTPSAATSSPATRGRGPGAGFSCRRHRRGARDLHSPHLPSVVGHLLHLLMRTCLHVAADAGPVEHGTVRVLAGHTAEMITSPSGWCTASTSKPPAGSPLGPPPGTGSPERRARSAPRARRRGHVAPEVLDHARLLLGGHVHECRQEHHIVGRLSRSSSPSDFGLSDE